MGDDEHRFISHTAQIGQHPLFGGRIQGAGTFIQQQNRPVRKDGPGNGQPLPLPFGQALACASLSVLARTVPSLPGVCIVTGMGWAPVRLHRMLMTFPLGR